MSAASASTSRTPRKRPGKDTTVPWAVGAHPIGTRLRFRPELLYCVRGVCGECSPEKLTRCWQRRAQARMELTVTGYVRTSLSWGAGYSVELTRPRGVWERRAWGGTGEGLVYHSEVEPL